MTRKSCAKRLSCHLTFLHHLLGCLESSPVSRRPRMTIGIGVLCSSKIRPHPTRPDGIILMADTMGSTDTDSTPELHKLCVEDDIYAVCAGKVEFASEIISVFKQELAQIPSRTLGNVWEALNRAVHEHRM